MVKAFLMCLFLLIAGLCFYNGVPALLAGEAGALITCAIGVGSLFLFCAVAQAEVSGAAMDVSHL